MSGETVADRLHGWLVALQACAESGAEKGWDHLLTQIGAVVGVAREDCSHSRDEEDVEPGPRPALKP